MLRLLSIFALAIMCKKPILLTDIFVAGADRPVGGAVLFQRGGGVNTESRLIRDYYWAKLGSLRALESGAPASDYDLELLYVECRLCGKPVLWEHGRMQAIIKASGMDASLLDESCLILSEGCPMCKPEHSGFQLHMVRLTSFSPQDMLLMGEAKGSA